MMPCDIFELLLCYYFLPSVDMFLREFKN